MKNNLRPLKKETSCKQGNKSIARTLLLISVCEPIMKSSKLNKVNKVKSSEKLVSLSFRWFNL